MNGAEAVVLLRDVVLLLALGIAVYTDATKGKIYNWLTVPLIVFGLAMSIVLGAFEPEHGNRLLDIVGAPFVSSIAGLALAFAIFGLAYLFHMLGGGDVKLLCGIGAVLGWQLFLGAAFFTACAGAVIAVIVLIWHGRLSEGLKSSALVFISPRSLAKQRESNPDAAEHKTIHYSYAIAIGTLTAWILSSMRG